MKSEELLVRLCGDIVRLTKPRKVLLFSEKHKPDGNLHAVKLCVIIDGGDPRQVEHMIYIKVESELPFDVLVYTVEEWKRHLKNQMSFAAKIRCTGRVLYEAD